MSDIRHPLPAALLAELEGRAWRLENGGTSSLAHRRRAGGGLAAPHPRKTGAAAGAKHYSTLSERADLIMTIDTVAKTVEPKAILQWKRYASDWETSALYEEQAVYEAMASWSLEIEVHKGKGLRKVQGRYRIREQDGIHTEGKGGWNVTRSMPLPAPRYSQGRIIARHVATLDEATAIAERDNRARMENGSNQP
jgi:hypothetical protein